MKHKTSPKPNVALAIWNCEPWMKGVMFCLIEFANALGITVIICDNISVRTNGV